MDYTHIQIKTSLNVFFISQGDAIGLNYIGLTARKYVIHFRIASPLAADRNDVCSPCLMSLRGVSRSNPSLLRHCEARSAEAIQKT
ncbi:MAG: hypothetical protein FWD66_02535 [Paludibacter sp.]|nr:hypothetical protein [Paludibacter sp.]